MRYFTQSRAAPRLFLRCATCLSALRHV